MRVKVKCDGVEQIIDNVIQADMGMGDKTALTDICGSQFGRGICSKCEDAKNNKGCAQVYIIGYIQGAPRDLQITTSDQDYIFTGNDLDFEVLPKVDAGKNGCIEYADWLLWNGTDLKLNTYSCTSHLSEMVSSDIIRIEPIKNNNFKPNNSGRLCHYGWFNCLHND